MKNPLLSSFFGAEDRRFPIFEDPKIEELPIFNFRCSNSKIEELLSAPKNGSKIERKKGDCDFFFRKNPLFSSFSARRTKNSPSSTFSAGRMEDEPPWYFFSRPPQAPAALSYSEVWIFRPIFHLEDRSEDPDRSATPFSLIVLNARIMSHRARCRKYLHIRVVDTAFCRDNCPVFSHSNSNEFVFRFLRYHVRLKTSYARVAILAQAILAQAILAQGSRP